ncbi:hypothetical protein IOD16_06510 [Saccharothrix sp. 6-C]|uniref:hypothetical protein n=1 Tax=Saccharothrix sp. 6-C TaxID=2781735 RepID=UPI0019179728|nr:hypothetical protein [Saccharothrix sp. 6-C]QQQ78123.1 hypothetical protein IOD16_06510 [Saccharothrix sp. 6-C]
MSRSTEEPALVVLDPPRSVFRRKRFLLPFGVSAAIALVGAFVLFANGVAALPFQGVTVVRAMMASKSEFFADPEVRRVLMANGVQVHVTDSGGSTEIAKERANPTSFDFVMPSGQLTARQIHDRVGGKPFYPFTTPLVVAAFSDYAKALAKRGVATPQEDTDGLYYTLDMTKFVMLTLDGETWNSIPDGGLTNANQIIAQSPDPCRAYSGAAYLAVVAFAANDKHAPTAAEAKAVATKIKPLFEVEGQFGAGIGRTFFSPDGRTFAPVGVMYEHQYLAYQIRTKEQTGSVDHDRVLLYPDAHHHAEPWLIAFSEQGEKVGRLLQEDSRLQRRALELGFRLGRAGSASVGTVLDERGIPKGNPGQGDTETFVAKPDALATMIEELGSCPSGVPL